MPDNYRALTRTYRPRTFDEIVSQDHVSETLKNAIEQQRLAHAYMFCGPRGVGKTTMARTVNEVEQRETNYLKLRKSMKSTRVTKSRQLVRVYLSPIYLSVSGSGIFDRNVKSFVIC